MPAGMELLRATALESRSGTPPGRPSEAVSMNDVTHIFSAIEQGDPKAAEQLLPLVYDELRKLAAHRLAQERPGQTLQATALVHEVYLRLVDTEKVRRWESRGHFFAAAAEAMRRILVENARRKGRLKRGGGQKRIELDDPRLEYNEPVDELLAIDEALEQLASEDPQAAQLVKLRYFGGLSIEDAAEMVGISRSTAYEHWAYARAWLHRRLHGPRVEHRVQKKTSSPSDKSATDGAWKGDDPRPR
jgi:RNA polymerase sigma factor (TIGR02999 family)